MPRIAISYANKLGQLVQKVMGKFLKAFSTFRNIISLEIHTRKYFKLAIVLKVVNIDVNSLLSLRRCN